MDAVSISGAAQVLLDAARLMEKHFGDQEIHMEQAERCRSVANQLRQDEVAYPSSGAALKAWRKEAAQMLLQVRLPVLERLP